MITLIKKIIAIIILIPVGMVVLYLVYPNVSYLKENNPEKTSFMKYREKEWEKRGEKKTIRQTWVPLSKISSYVTQAVIISEDDKFWQHEGFDYEAMKDAFEKDLKKKELRYGGSTITQQLAKNLYLTPSKNPLRKVKEAVLAWRLERTLSKKRIMELYLNVIEWGDGVFGIEEASKINFSKSASGLDPMEAALLAVILPNPQKLRAKNPTPFVKNRANIIYSRMQRRNIVLPDFEQIVSDSTNSEIEKESDSVEKLEIMVNDSLVQPTTPE